MKAEYDMRRLPYGLALDVHQDLRRAVEAASAPYVSEDVVKSASEDFGNNRSAMKALCRQLIVIGAPDYWPEYIQEAGPAPSTVQRQPLIWLELLREELDCVG